LIVVEIAAAPLIGCSWLCGLILLQVHNYTRYAQESQDVRALGTQEQGWCFLQLFAVRTNKCWHGSRFMLIFILVLFRAKGQLLELAVAGRLQCVLG
jgi:hypothetical protein